MRQILQIIPAPSNLFVTFAVDQPGEPPYRVPVVCIALEESEYGTHRKLCTMHSNGQIEVVERCDEVSLPGFTY